ncbi:MAG: trypsin-like peptidase domain-containing protein [Bacteriovoracaceae bacterium]|nr:trypsin-like peptidase domain-containing protein [Bacteriovoracaceae bacterium]
MKLLICSLIITTLTFSATHVIYGDDNRMDIEDVLNPEVKKLASSVAGRIHLNAIYLKGDTFSYDYVPKMTDPWGASICADEKFATQASLVDCTGFLIGPDLLATAAHCVMSTDEIIKKKQTTSCARHAWVFDYQLKNKKLQEKGIALDKLYYCKHVVVGDYRGMADYAIIKLDRVVEGRKPLKLRKKGRVKNKTKLFALGHPSGLPLKYTDEAKVVTNSHREFFSANLDTFQGNSGSPVFNAEDNVVEGIVVRGRTDYIDGEYDGLYCQKVNKCKDDGSECEFDDEEFGDDGEHITRITRLLEYI